MTTFQYTDIFDIVGLGDIRETGEEKTRQNACILTLPYKFFSLFFCFVYLFVVFMN